MNALEVKQDSEVYGIYNILDDGFCKLYAY